RTRAARRRLQRLSGRARAALLPGQHHSEPDPRAERRIPAGVGPGILAAGGRAVRGGASVRMVRRSLGVALWMIVGLLACFLGALSALVGTGAGRALLARVMENALAQVFTGAIEVADVRGSLLTGVTLTGVRLFDADSTLVAWLPRADLAYNPFDFAAGRVVLFEFALRQPVINIVQHRSGRLNIEELLPLGAPAGGRRGPAARARGLARRRPVAGQVSRVHAAGGAGRRLLATRPAAVRSLPARRFSDAE